MAKGRKGRKRKAAVALPAVGQGAASGKRAKRGIARATLASVAQGWSLERELAALGPCPPMTLTPFERDLQAQFDRAWVTAMRHLPEIGRLIDPERVVAWRRHRVAKRQPDALARAIVASQRDPAEVEASNRWLERRRTLYDEDRRIRHELGSRNMVDVMKDPRTGLETALFGNDRGAPERARQDGGTFTTTAPNSDRRSQPVTVARASDTLGRLLRSQTINRAQHKVARKFEADFSLGQFDRYPTARLERTDGGDADCGDGIVIARDRIHAALKLLGGSGSDMSNLMWNVVGAGMSLRDWVVHRRMSQPRRLTVPIATGLLSGALAILHGFYFLESKTSSAMADDNPLLYRDAGRAGPDAPPFAARATEFMAQAEKREREVVS